LAYILGFKEYCANLGLLSTEKSAVFSAFPEKIGKQQLFFMEENHTSKWIRGVYWIFKDFFAKPLSS
jgi:hypothetical protein